VSTWGRNLFGSGRVHVSLNNFGSDSCRIIVSDQTFPTLLPQTVATTTAESGRPCVAKILKIVNSGWLHKLTRG